MIRLTIRNLAITALLCLGGQACSPVAIDGDMLNKLLNVDDGQCRRVVADGGGQFHIPYFGTGTYSANSYDDNQPVPTNTALSDIDGGEAMIAPSPPLQTESGTLKGTAQVGDRLCPWGATVCPAMAEWLPFNYSRNRNDHTAGLGLSAIQPGAQNFSGYLSINSAAHKQLQGIRTLCVKSIELDVGLHLYSTSPIGAPGSSEPGGTGGAEPDSSGGTASVGFASDPNQTVTSPPIMTEPPVDSVPPPYYQSYGELTGKIILHTVERGAVILDDSDTLQPIPLPEPYPLPIPMPPDHLPTSRDFAE